MTLLVSDRPLLIRDEFRPAGIPFDERDAEYAASLLERGAARHAAPPQVLFDRQVCYETRTPEQDAKRFREQGVTCLCLTKNRRMWLQKAIESYQAQSYAVRELLIIADGEDVSDLVPEQEDIRLVHIESGRKIGDKRNFGVSLAQGRYIAHWDDDDYSAPDRVLDQLHRLQASGLAVTGYSQLDFTDGAQWWRYHGENGDRLKAPGSSLFYERAWALAHPFLHIQVGEDEQFSLTAKKHSQITTAFANGMLRASIHAENTSPRTTHDVDFWKQLRTSRAGLSVIIPSKTDSNFAACLAAVKEHEPTARVILIDDGLSGDYKVGKRLKGEKPFIFARNINIGIRAAGRDDVILLNDDAILKTPGGFSLLQEAAREHPDYGLIASTTNAVGNANQHPRRSCSSLRQDPRMVCFVAVFIARALLDMIGYLDERFDAYGFEDDDFCYRARRAGFKIGIHDGSFVDHASLKSTFRGGAFVGAQLDGGRRIFVEKWGSYPL